MTERMPELHVYTASGPGAREWRITCRTCGWEIKGTGDRPREADDSARTHRCPTDDDVPDELEDAARQEQEYPPDETNEG